MRRLGTLLLVLLALTADLLQPSEAGVADASRRAVRGLLNVDFAPDEVPDHLHSLPAMQAVFQ
jgi:hypothetical protein